MHDLQDNESGLGAWSPCRTRCRRNLQPDGSPVSSGPATFGLTCDASKQLLPLSVLKAASRPAPPRPPPPPPSRSLSPLAAPSPSPLSSSTSSCRCCRRGRRRGRRGSFTKMGDLAPPHRRGWRGARRRGCLGVQLCGGSARLAHRRVVRSNDDERPSNNLVDIQWLSFEDVS